jgi:hypothetical protein
MQQPLHAPSRNEQQKRGLGSPSGVLGRYRQSMCLKEATR